MKARNTDTFVQQCIEFVSGCNHENAYNVMVYISFIDNSVGTFGLQNTLYKLPKGTCSWQLCAAYSHAPLAIEI